MQNPRTLNLKRDVLVELSTDELTGVVGGTVKTVEVRETLYSCYAYISCGVVECLPTLRGCIE